MKSASGSLGEDPFAFKPANIPDPRAVGAAGLPGDGARPHPGAPEGTLGCADVRGSVAR